MSSSLVTLGAAELCTLLARGDVSSVEVTKALLDRLDELQPTVRPMAVIWRDQALRQAQDSDARRSNHRPLSPYDGLPVTIKECIDVKGADTTLGVEAHRGKPATSDAVVVRLLREAGCVFLGKTNVSQFLLFHESSNPVFGRTRNPHDLQRTPGGSSGGEAAAIAAYASAGGIGSDIGGSIRVPAHFCGIAGLKPTVDRISNMGVRTALAGQEVVRGQCGPMARSVDDLICLLRIVDPLRCAALDPRVPPMSLGDPAHVDISKLRVGFYSDDGIVQPSAALQRGVRAAYDVLAEAGVTLVRLTPVLSEELIMTYLAALSSDGGRTVEGQLAGGPADENLGLLRKLAKLPRTAKRAAALGMRLKGEELVSQMLSHMGERSVAELWALTARVRAMQAQIYATWNELEIDAVLCPPHATPALPHGASRDFTLGASLSMRYNFLNLPAGVVPVTRVRHEETSREKPWQSRLQRRAAEVDRDSAGLPVGVQVVARPFREDIALALMKAIEQGTKHRKDYPSLPTP